MEISVVGTPGEKPVVTLMEKPVVESSVEKTLGAIGMGYGAVGSPENVRVAMQGGEILGEAKSGVVQTIEVDEQRREELRQSRDGKQKELSGVYQKIEELNEVITIADSFVAEADVMIAENEKLRELALEEKRKLTEKYEVKREEVGAETAARIARIGQEAAAKKSQLKEVVLTRPEVVGREDWRQRVRAVEKLEEVVTSPNLSEALAMFEKDAGVDMTAGVGAMKAKAVEFGEKYREMALAAREERKRLNEEAEAMRANEEQKANEERKVSAGEFDRESKVFEDRIALYEKRGEEYKALRLKYILGSEKAQRELSPQLDAASVLQEKIREENGKIFSLGAGIGAQNELLEKLGTAIEANTEALAAEGRQIIDGALFAVNNLGELFEKKVVEDVDELMSYVQGGFDQLGAEHKRRDEAAQATRKKAEEETTEKLVATGLYQLGPEGVIERSPAKGLGALLAERAKAGEAEAILKGYEARLTEFDQADLKYSEQMRNRIGLFVEFGTLQTGVVLDYAAAERVKYVSAAASLEAVAAALPPEPEARPTEPQSWYREPIRAVGGLFKKIFGKSS